MTDERPRRRDRDRRQRRPHLDPIPGSGPARRRRRDRAPTLRERFEAALAPGPADGAAPRDVEIARSLAEAPVERIARGGLRQQRGLPARARRPGPGRPGPAACARSTSPSAASVRSGTSRAGPSTSARWPRTSSTPRSGFTASRSPCCATDRSVPGSVQRFVHVAREPADARAGRSPRGPASRRGACSTCSSTTPTASGPTSWSSTVPDVHAIDNALSFLPYPRQRTALISLGGSQLPSRLAKRVQGLAGDVDADDRAADAAAPAAQRGRGRRLHPPCHRARRRPDLPEARRLGRPALRVVVRRPAGPAGRLGGGRRVPASPIAGVEPAHVRARRYGSPGAWWWLPASTWSP